MDENFATNLQQLRTPCVETWFLREMFGIAWPPNDLFAADYQSWAKNCGACEGEQVNRHCFESFLQSQRLTTAKLSALALGMTEDSFFRLLDKLADLGLRRQYQVYPGIIDTSLKDDLVRALSATRYRTFATHDSFCEGLHSAVYQELGIEIEKLPCATSVALGEEPAHYAGTLDSITLQPLSITHQVWLDFGKPLNLAPDGCSKLTLAQNVEALRPFIAGRTMPNLDRYEAVAREG